MIAEGASVAGTDSEGRTALLWAAREGHGEVAGVLVLAGADMQASRKDGITPLHWAAEWGHAATVGVLLDLGANFAARDSRGHTALEAAVEGGHADVAKLLWEKGVAVAAKVNGGLRPVHEWEVMGGDEGPEVLLHLAAQNGHAGNRSLPPLLASLEGEFPSSRLTLHPRLLS
ncbi:ankyrin repeat-containing domain protein [Baffinella frigidus]|nr:ankyrin repeat-containing domain protein [Cryptophyta sp. CCMP2293]